MTCDDLKLVSKKKYYVIMWLLEGLGAGIGYYLAKK